MRAGEGGVALELGEEGVTPLSAFSSAPLAAKSPEEVEVGVLVPFTSGETETERASGLPWPPSPPLPAVASPVSVGVNWGRCASARDPGCGSRATRLSFAAHTRASLPRRRLPIGAHPRRA